MTIPGFLKKKRTYVIAAIILVLFFWISSRGGSKPEDAYETAAVEKTDLRQTVEVTGEVKPAERIELSFERGGTIKNVSAKVGDTVTKGTLLAELEDQDAGFAAQSAAASLAVAQANLNQRLAGETKQNVRIAETNVIKAQAAYDKAVSDLEATRITVQDNLRAAQLSADTAKNKLENQSGTLQQNRENALENLRVALLTALGPLQSALVDGDMIIGVDDTAANSTYQNVLGIHDSTSVPRAKTSYQLAKPVKVAAESAVIKLTASSTEAQLKSASDQVRDASLLVQAYLTDVQKVLAATITGPSLSATELASKKSQIDGDRTAISAQNAAVLAAIQTVDNVSLSNTDLKQQLQDAYTASLVNLDIARTKMGTDVKTAEANAAIQLAALQSAQADFDQRKAPVREVDLAPLRAAVTQAQVQYDKAVNDISKTKIVAPVDGTVSEVLPDPGELIASNAVAIRLVGTSQYDIEALVPEADITKITVGQKAEITLDAYGDNVVFPGTVTAKDPAETTVQDAVYYKIRVQVEPDGKEVKPGMTANVTVLTAEAKGALVIPSRAVKTDAEKKTQSVRILENGQPKDVTIVTGLRGDEGRVEVTSGLAEKQTIIVSEKNP
jgi:HlyD family secretion protein